MKTDLGRIEVPVKDLMRGNKNIVLLHDEKRYALTITRRGKLILTADEKAQSAKISIQNNI
ncbi:MAG: hemin uptake protein HemP [Cocleimonas sp.]